jgi:hypothetical protein
VRVKIRFLVHVLLTTTRLCIKVNCLGQISTSNPAVETLA